MVNKGDRVLGLPQTDGLASIPVSVWFLERCVDCHVSDNGFVHAHGDTDIIEKALDSFELPVVGRPMPGDDNDLYLILEEDVEVPV